MLVNTSHASGDVDWKWQLSNPIQGKLRTGESDVGASVRRCAASHLEKIQGESNSELKILMARITSPVTGAAHTARCRRACNRAPPEACRSGRLPGIPSHCPRAGGHDGDSDEGETAFYLFGKSQEEVEFLAREASQNVAPDSATSAVAAPHKLEEHPDELEVEDFPAPCLRSGVRCRPSAETPPQGPQTACSASPRDAQFSSGSTPSSTPLSSLSRLTPSMSFGAPGPLPCLKFYLVMQTMHCREPAFRHARGGVPTIPIAPAESDQIEENSSAETVIYKFSQISRQSASSCLLLIIAV